MLRNRIGPCSARTPNGLLPSLTDIFFEALAVALEFGLVAGDLDLELVPLVLLEVLNVAGLEIEFHAAQKHIVIAARARQKLELKSQIAGQLAGGFDDHVPFDRRVQGSS